jgi:hypothetical protein
VVPPHPEAADALQVCIEQTRARRQRPLVDADGAKTVTTHRFRHTVGTQLAEEGARIQTIMAIIGHTSPAMSLFYARITDTAVLRDYQAALQPGAHLAGPSRRGNRNNELSQQAVEWLASNYYKTALELGHCLRLPAEGPCECDLFLTCSKFFATAEYAPRLRERLCPERRLADDAAARGWPREVERHNATATRIAASFVLDHRVDQRKVPRVESGQKRRR